MNKVTSALLLAMASSTTFANTITGKVVDQSGNSVNEGEVTIVGTSMSVPINADGTFTIRSIRLGNIELHVSAPDYVHNHLPINIDSTGINGLEIVVNNSSVEVLDITGTLIHTSTIESALPVNVLSMDALNREQMATLGDSLTNQVGIHSSSHGSVTSTPIIRGLSGPRVLIAQNGLDAGDVSRVGPDHFVSTDASSAEQIEVLRGPATLFYGSGAIGGVVNVVDNRIPTSQTQSGELAVSNNTNNNENALNGQFATGNNDFAFNMQGFYRDADEYKIPGMAEDHSEHRHEEHAHEEGHEHEHENNDIVDSSDYESQGFTIGASRLFDNGHIGFAVETQDHNYGIPGHSHDDAAHDHEGEHEEEHDHEEHSHEEEQVRLDMKQTRYQLSGAYQFEQGFIQSLEYSGAYTDYEHTELENGEPGTSYNSESTELRFSAVHEQWNGWNGGLSLHYKSTDLAAFGDEAFTPPSESEMFAIGWLEEKEYGDVLLQLGARVERIEINVPDLIHPDIDLTELEYDGHEHEHAGHDEHENEHEGHNEHEHDHEEALTSAKETFTPVSLSAGLVWNFQPGYNVSASFSRAERAPSSAELFSLGPHLGSGFYEIGALYEIDDEGHVVVGNADFDVETSNNLDVSFKKFEGDLGIIFNVFYNQVDNYYFDANTGFAAEFAHDHADEHGEEMHDEHGHDDHEHDHGNEHEHGGELLPVINFMSADVDLYGAELQVNYKLTDTLTLITQADMVRARVDSDESSTELPRTSPMRWSAKAQYEVNNWYADFSVRHVFEQDKVATFEEKTDGYTFVDFNVSYYMPVNEYEVEFFLKGRNITDEEARVHTSYLKSEAPLPGRSFIVGARASF